MRLPRTTGLLSGLLIVVLGAWAGLIPFVGPYFDYGFTPDETWHYSSTRLWLSILPGAVAIVGGLLMMLASRRPTGALGGWLAMAAGAWLIVGPSLSLLWQDRAGIGDPLGGPHRHAIEWIGYFYGAGALILGLAAFATGRFVSRPHVADRAAAAATEDAEDVEEPHTEPTPRPAPREPSRRFERQPAAEDPAPTSTTTTTNTPTNGEESAEGRTAVAASSRPDGAERESAPRASAAEPVRVRRRRGGLVGRFLRRDQDS